MILHFNPFENVGNFQINSNIKDYVHNYSFTFTPINDTTEWETYELVDEGIVIYVEKDLIISISCDTELLYKGRNIIGMNINEFINFSNFKPDDFIDKLWVSDDEQQEVYEFFDIGLQVWCSDNVIVTVIAS